MLINGSDEQAAPTSRSACTARDRQLCAGLGSIRIAVRDLPHVGELEEVEEELRGAWAGLRFSAALPRTQAEEVSDRVGVDPELFLRVEMACAK
jgi:hypothetical protein